MTPKTWIGASAALVTLGAAFLTWRAARAAAGAESEIAALRAERARAEKSWRELQAKLEAAETQRRELEGALADLRVAPLAKKDVAAAKPANVNLTEAILRDPKLQALQLESVRAQFRARYGPLLQRLNLTEAQIAKLTEARVKSVAAGMDLQAVMNQQKLAGNDPVIQKLRREAEDELRTAQTEALGADGFAELKDYDRTMPARETVNHLAGAAALNGVPLTADQAERLTAILAAAGKSGRNGVNLSNIDWAAVDLQAQGVLSAAQLALFQQTEPIGGGASRWSARLNKEMEKAQGITLSPASK